MLCIHCRKHAERHTNCHRYRCCVVELGCSPWTRVSSGADVDRLRAPGVHATDVGARCDETGGCHKTPMPIVMVACRLQVLPANFEEVNYAVCRRDPEKGKGSKLSGVSLDAPLAIIAQQGLFFIKFVLVVAAPPNVARSCAKETLIEASRRRAAERFWPTAADEGGTILYKKGPNQVHIARTLIAVVVMVGMLQAIRDIANKLWQIVNADTATYGGYSTQKEADAATHGKRLINRLAQCCWALVPHARAAGFKKHGGDMSQKCTLFLIAAEERCSQDKHPSLTENGCSEIRDQLNFWIRQLPPVFKLRAQISALRDIAGNHAKYLRDSNMERLANHSRDMTDKVVDKRNYVVAPARDALWSSFTAGDRGAASRINNRLNHWCEDYELFRIDNMLLSDEEEAHCATLANPDNLKYQRINRLFPTNGSGSPFIRRLHVYRFAAGANIGGVWNFIAPLPTAQPGTEPDTPSSEELSRIVQAVTFLKEKRLVPNYIPRAVLRAFKDRYCDNIDGLSASAMSELVAHVCGDDSSGSHGQADKARRERIKLFLEQDEEDVEDIIVDLRRHNGSSEVYTKFYKIMAEFLDAELTKVDARRHQALSAVPPAWSVSNLICKIKQFAGEKALCPIAGANAYLLTDDDIPSEQWVRLCFCPSNPWIKSSAAYQCRFDLQFNLLSRTAHHEHIDSEYAARVFKHLRELACELKHCGVTVAFIFADDKCSAKVGEPGDPIGAVERNKRVVGNNELRAIASRHDFAKFKVNPSVLLLLAGSDIPDSVFESFYRGRVWVSVKDAVFQPSSPMRHSAEILKVLKAAKLLDDLQVLLLYTDGGPDHNITFMTVILSLLCLFLTGDLDFVVAARTCPQQSWRNCVEKIMCILNLAMYGVALVRDSMPGEMEEKCRTAKQSMAGIRAASQAFQVVPSGTFLEGSSS